MQSVSPAYNPRETWSAQKQHARGFDDCWARRPAALYPWKRADWFAKAFAAEEAVRAAPAFGSRDSDYRDGELELDGAEDGAEETEGGDDGKPERVD